MASVEAESRQVKAHRGLAWSLDLEVERPGQWPGATSVQWRLVPWWCWCACVRGGLTYSTVEKYNHIR
eukprot:411792-Prymnesium_polylepis.2